MNRATKVLKSRAAHRKTLHTLNQYAIYIAKQESSEIDNAILTLSKLQKSNTNCSPIKVTVRTK